MIEDFEKVVGNDYKNVKVEYNFHSHDYLCKHAVGDVYDYVNVAVQNGLKVIGISDHAIFPALYGAHLPYLDVKDIDALYLPQFEKAEKAFSGDIKIKKGIEIEYFDGNDDVYKKLLEKLDYLILGEHFVPYNGGWSFAFSSHTEEEAIYLYDVMIKGVKSGYFKICAHPDVVFSGVCPKTEKTLAKMDELISECVDNGVLVELNANGIRSNGWRYPTDELVEICKKRNAKVIVSSDNHKPEYLCDDYMKKLLCYAYKKGLNVAKAEDINV